MLKAVSFSFTSLSSLMMIINLFNYQNDQISKNLGNTVFRTISLPTPSLLPQQKDLFLKISLDS